MRPRHPHPHGLHLWERIALGASTPPTQARKPQPGATVTTGSSMPLGCGQGLGTEEDGEEGLRYVQRPLRLNGGDFGRWWEYWRAHSSRLTHCSGGHTRALRRKTQTPGWCGSVDWAPACELKGLWFDSQSGHVPGLRVRSPVGVSERQPHIDVSLPLFLPPSLPFSVKVNQ